MTCRCLLLTLVVLVPHFFWFHVEAASQPRLTKDIRRFDGTTRVGKKKSKHSWNTGTLHFRRRNTHPLQENNIRIPWIIRPSLDVGFSAQNFVKLRVSIATDMWKPPNLAPKAQIPNHFSVPKEKQALPEVSIIRKYPSYSEIVWYESTVPSTALWFAVSSCREHPQ